MRPWTNPSSLLLALAVSCANQSRAEDLARQFASSNYPGEPVNNVSCEWRDSDDNGRVRCNLSVGTPARVQTLDCPSHWFVGCASQCLVTTR